MKKRNKRNKYINDGNKKKKEVYDERKEQDKGNDISNMKEEEIQRN